MLISLSGTLLSTRISEKTKSSLDRAKGVEDPRYWGDDTNRISVSAGKNTSFYNLTYVLLFPSYCLTRKKSQFIAFAIQ